LEGLKPPIHRFNIYRLSDGRLTFTLSMASVDRCKILGLDTRSGRGRSQHMSRVEMVECDVSVDAAIIAAGFAIDARLVRDLMRKGLITSLCERGLEGEAEQYRLTFFHGKQRFRLVTDADGNILERSTTDCDHEVP
jgi:hypothetical protein